MPPKPAPLLRSPTIVNIMDHGAVLGGEEDCARALEGAMREAHRRMDLARDEAAEGARHEEVSVSMPPGVYRLGGTRLIVG